MYQTFCDAGSKYFEDPSKSDSQEKKDFEIAIRDYLVMRKAAQEQKEILELNRVGVEKDMKKIIASTAKYVGVSMPKTYEGAPTPRAA